MKTKSFSLRNAYQNEFLPVAIADIRERVELKFRARGAVAFHLFVMLGFGIVLLYNLPDLWLMRRGNSGFIDYTIPYVFLSAAGALHFIRYYFRHGRGRDRHEQETEERVAAQLQDTIAEEAEEQEELVRLQMKDKLGSGRLVLQHLTIYIGFVALMVLLQVPWLRDFEIGDWSNWRDIVTVAGIWGFGLAAHVLRYVFAYGFSAAGREAKIQAQVSRESSNRIGKARQQAPGAQKDPLELLARWRMALQPNS